ncbi:MAG: hypothetical protein AAFZ18_13065 [Myxococcota bacterium]
MTDGILAHVHPLERPSASEVTPILIEENPSRDLYFPLSGAECLAAMAALPRRVTEGITHVWLRRVTRRALDRGEHPLASYVLGSGVRAVVLFPWRTDNLIRFGAKAPQGDTRRDYERFGAQIVRRGECWYGEFSDVALRRFYLEYLLFHEIGHHLDGQRRHWSRAHRRACEEAADQYALSWAKAAAHALHRIEKARAMSAAIDSSRARASGGDQP